MMKSLEERAERLITEIWLEDIQTSEPLPNDLLIIRCKLPKLIKRFTITLALDLTCEDIETAIIEAETAWEQYKNWKVQSAQMQLGNFSDSWLVTGLDPKG